MGTSVALIALGIWLMGWSDAGSEPDSLPWNGMIPLGIGLIGLVLCILTSLLGRDLTVRKALHPDADPSATGSVQPTNNEGIPTMSGKFDQIKGRAKEAAGDLTDDDDLKREGQADRATGKVKEKVEEAKDWVEDKIDGARNKVD